MIPKVKHETTPESFAEFLGNISPVSSYGLSVFLKTFFDIHL